MHIHRRRVLHKVRVNRIAPRENFAGDQHHIADLQSAHIRLRQRLMQHHFAAG